MIFPPLPRARQAIDIPSRDWVSLYHDDNGDRLGRLLGGTDRCKVSADKHIDFELHEFGHKAWDTVQLALSVAILTKMFFPSV